MKSSEWRHYRGCLIVKNRSAILGLRRFEVWDRGTLLGTFRDVVRAELCVDRHLTDRGARQTGAASGT
jgi:hypothetical protein